MYRNGTGRTICTFLSILIPKGVHEIAPWSAEVASQPPPAASPLSTITLPHEPDTAQDLASGPIVLPADIQGRRMAVVSRRGGGTIRREIGPRWADVGHGRQWVGDETCRRVTGEICRHVTGEISRHVTGLVRPEAVA